MGYILQRMVQDTNEARLIFYPMAGAVNEQFDNLLETLRWVNDNTPSPNGVHEWLRSKYGLSHYFARNIYTVLLRSSGLIEVRGNKCYLSSEGQDVLVTASPTVLLETFEKAFIGIAALLEVLRSHPSMKAKPLSAQWFGIASKRFPALRNWSERTVNSQFRHRMNWLQAMGLVVSTTSGYALSESGWQFVQRHPPEAIAIQPHEIEEQEAQLHKVVSEPFQPFDLSPRKSYSLRQSFVRDRAFRKIVTFQYDYYCAICEFRLATPEKIYEADAAHIIPKGQQGSDDPRNGLSLCRTCHWLFDKGIVSVDARDLSVLVASYLQKEARDPSVRQVLEYRNRRIRSVKNHQYAPSPQALQWHNRQIFLG